ncbi:hypothetical protein SAMN05421847_2199 [Halpernia humi]|uniref:Uncharacterized protein n=1 Tax=Halpernia humi TaxID=493375 RepID=A0A1H5ZUN5_9FLAO|nr:hypothetical protein [Halpernia humi]SEG39684.1 hypothetical protein SAMN05421847_2199 [Halpernia humi]
MIRTIYGRIKEKKIALIPITNTSSMNMQISTRNGDSVIDKGDGSTPFGFTNPKYFDYTITSSGAMNFSYSGVFTGNISIKFLKGLKDVYSISFTYPRTAANTNLFNIADVSIFLKQFPNLYSFRIENYSYGANFPTINGNVLDMPDSVEVIYGYDFQIAGTVNFNMSGISSTSKLRILNIQGNNSVGAKKLLGNLAKMPTSLTFLSLKFATSGSAISYSGGKTWASAFDTLLLPIALTNAENNTLLNDMANTITSAIGGKLINLKGNRTSASDAAVTYLQSLGFTITINRI